MRFNTKITISILELSVIPLLLSGFIAYSTFREEVKNRTLSEMDTIAQIQKNRLSDIFVNEERLLGLFLSKVSQLEEVKSFIKKPNPKDQAIINSYLLDTKMNIHGVQKIWIADTQGVIIGSSDLSLVGTNVSKEDFFSKGMQQLDVSILRKENEIITQYFVGPLILNGETFGVASLIFSPETLFGLTSDYTGLGKTGETLLVKNEGKGNALFLAPIRFDKNSALTRIIPKENTNVPAIEAVSEKEGTFIGVDYRGVPVFSATRFFKDTRWGIVVKIDQNEAYSSIIKIEKLFIFFTLFAIFLIFFVASSLSRSVTKPIKKLIALTKRVAQGDFSQKVSIDSRDEIGELAQSFNFMMWSVKELRRDVDEKVRVQTTDILAKEKLLEEQKNDLEKQVKTSDELSNDLLKFKLVVDNVSDVIVITDPEGIMIYGNKMIKTITGYDTEEAIGKKAAVLWKLPMPKKVYEEMWKTIKIEKKPYFGQIKNKRKNGVIYDVGILISPVLDASNTILFFVGIERDITREKEIDRAKTEFVSLSSHQLRTPISSINWNTEMLLNGDAGPMNEKQMQFLKEVYSLSKRMIALINAFLDVSRVEVGTFSGEPKSVNVNEAAQDILRELRPMTEKRKQHVVENYDPKIPVIFTDIKIIHAIFQNLISNATKYTKDGGEIGVKTTLSQDGKDIMIEISDNGVGIPEDQKHQIFERFFRTEVAREVDTDGTGLGLYLLKLITDKISGKITFTSELDKGTTFFVTLPIEGLTVKEEKV